MKRFLLRCLFAIAFALPAASALPQDSSSTDLAKLLSTDIIDDLQSLTEVQRFTASRVPAAPKPASRDEWEKRAEQLRNDVLEKIVFRGEARQWRQGKTQVEWLDEMEGGEGYRIRKLRYEVVPGLWVPALLYEPIELDGLVPVVMNVNGHDRNGKAADYKQTRCINQAKRGMLALNVEWLGMGQLATENFGHYRMNQLDLCGTSGLAPFYLAMQRGLDVLLEHPHADPKRVAVAGLSGGGWQTIVISSLDTRVVLSNPVAGYSSYRTRAGRQPDLGDSEQTPVDLATVADYTHLTALRAPRPTLLTYNAKDNCCFVAEFALPPLVEAAKPIYELYGKPEFLQTHINHDPGDHNFGLENREQFYRVLGQFFYPDDSDYSARELECEGELKTAEQLHVPLPEGNGDFHTLALRLAKDLPRHGTVPESEDEARRWLKEGRERLREVLRLPRYSVEPKRTGENSEGQVTATFYQLKMNEEWTLPAVRLQGPNPPKGTAIVVDDRGRAATGDACQKWLDKGYAVLAVDPFYFGESKIQGRDFLYGLLISAVGERPLGIQAAQLAAIARWLDQESSQPVVLSATGPRSSLFSLAATALEPRIDAVHLHQSYGSLKQILEQNMGVNEAPELFCFGLLEQFDILQLAALVGDREVHFHDPSERVRGELGPLEAWRERQIEPASSR